MTQATLHTNYGDIVIELFPNHAPETVSNFVGLATGEKEWTDIIVIFVPIFLPLLAHFQIDPMLWGVMVFVNLQAAFLSPPVAMSAFYLKGVSPPHVTINQIFAGMMPYMFIVILCLVLMYIWPELTLWLPNYLYGK